MVTSVDDLTIRNEGGDRCVIDELDRVVITTSGGWATVLFRYREIDLVTEEPGPVRFSLRRYRKYRSHFRRRKVISLSEDQARRVVDSLAAWLDRDDRTPFER